jgi:hypothetical protein
MPARIAGVFNPMAYAFPADCVKPAMSMRTPAPIVLETLTLRR